MESTSRMPLTQITKSDAMKSLSVIYLAHVGPELDRRNPRGFHGSTYLSIDWNYQLTLDWNNASAAAFDNDNSKLESVRKAVRANSSHVEGLPHFEYTLYKILGALIEPTATKAVMLMRVEKSFVGDRARIEGARKGGKWDKLYEAVHAVHQELVAAMKQEKAEAEADGMEIRH